MGRNRFSLIVVFLSLPLLLNSLFSGGPPPAAPFSECGPDPTPDALTCGSFEGCQ